MGNDSLSVLKQQAGEKVIKIVRKHWYTHVRTFLKLFLIILIPLILILFFMNDGGFLFLLTFYCFYLPYALLFIFIIWLNDSLDILIITNQRLIDITQVKFLHREISQTYLNQVQDVKVSESGLIRTFFKFGLIEVQTAAANVYFSMSHVAEPYVISDIILRAQSEYVP